MEKQVAPLNNSRAFFLLILFTAPFLSRSSYPLILLILLYSFPTLSPPFLSPSHSDG